MPSPISNRSSGARRTLVACDLRVKTSGYEPASRNTLFETAIVQMIIERANTMHFASISRRSRLSLVTRAFHTGTRSVDNSVFVFAELPSGPEKKGETATPGRKARKLCSEQGTMVLAVPWGTLCFSIIFNYFLKAATAFDAHASLHFLPPSTLHYIDPSHFSRVQLKVKRRKSRSSCLFLALFLPEHKRHHRSPNKERG